jgi:hypothetical protein
MCISAKRLEIVCGSIVDQPRPKSNQRESPILERVYNFLTWVGVYRIEEKDLKDRSFQVALG